jgi:hypothetical protein
LWSATWGPHAGYSCRTIPWKREPRLVRELTEPVQTIFFARRWRVITSLASEKMRLRTMLAGIEEATPAAPIAPTR